MASGTSRCRAIFKLNTKFCQLVRNQGSFSNIHLPLEHGVELSRKLPSGGMAMVTRTVGLLFWICLVNGAFGVDDDPLKEAKARMAIELARVESDIRQGLSEADRQASRDPIKARESYDRVRAMIERDGSLSEKRKAYLTDICRKKSDALDSARAADARAATDLAQQQAQKKKNPAATQGDQDDQISRRLKEIRDLQQGGQSAEAAKRAEELARKNPDNVAALAAARMQQVRGQINLNADLRSRMEANTMIAMRQIEEAGIPITGDLVFPPDWAEKSKRRSPGAKLTERERSVLKSLSTPMNLTIEGENFEYFLTAMEKQLGVSLLVDRPALEAAGVRVDSPVTVRARNWTGRSVLKKVLSDLGLSYIIRSEEIQITTAERTRETLVTRSYYIGDLLGISDTRFPPWYNQQQFAQTLASIIDSIKSQVDPRSWQPEGSGSIVFEPLSMSLIIRQTAEVHFLLGGSLR